EELAPHGSVAGLDPRSSAGVSDLGPVPAEPGAPPAEPVAPGHPGAAPQRVRPALWARGMRAVPMAHGGLLSQPRPAVLPLRAPSGRGHRPTLLRRLRQRPGRLGRAASAPGARAGGAGLERAGPSRRVPGARAVGAAQ